MIERLKPLAQRWLPASLPRPSPATLSRLLPVVLLALALTALGMMYLHHADSRYKPVFGAQEKVVAADVMSVLDAEGIPYRLHPDTGQVLVPDSRLGQVRMLLAARGVVARLPDGLEVVDQKDPLGVSQFVQDVRFRRGLEGELVQSIVTLDPVQSARVHLSVAKSSSFILSDGDKSSASVVLALKPGRRLNKEQVAAIIAMVSGSVANLDPARVSVVDQAGNFLSAGVDPASPHGGDNSELATRVREETLRNIQDLLGPTLGDGNFRASVAVEVDQDRIEETREQYGEAPRVTQEATREENDSGVIPLGVPGSLSNRPVAVAGAANDAPEGPRSQKNALTRQYVYDRNVVQIRRSPVRLKRLSVAVVLNNAVAPGDAGGGWNADQIARIEEVLRSGIGIDAARQDALVVSAMDFRPDGGHVVPPWWKDPENLVVALPWAGYAVLALLAFFLVVRPLLAILRQYAPQPPVAEAALVAGPAAQTLVAEPVQAPELAPPDPKLPPVGSDADVLVEHLRVLATQAPERVAEVLKPWIRKNG